MGTPIIANLAGLSVLASVGIISAEVVTRSSFSLSLERDMDAVFFNIGEFAESIPYSHKNGPSVTYSAIFDDPTASAGLISEVEVLAWRPQLRLKESALRMPPSKGDTCMVRGARYRTIEYNSDGVGTILIYLERA